MLSTKAKNALPPPRVRAEELVNDGWTSSIEIAARE